MGIDQVMRVEIKGFGNEGKLMEKMMEGEGKKIVEVQD